MDEAVILDQKYLKWLGPILKKLKQSQVPQAKVFHFESREAAKAFKAAADALGYHEHGIQSVYQIRHGSASTDMLNRVRSDAEIMKRGRWKRLSSLKTYEQGGRLSSASCPRPNRSQPQMPSPS